MTGKLGARSRRPRIACFITPHGYGHAARAAAVIGALGDLVPGLVPHLFTTVPRWFFSESLRLDFSLHRLESDVGLIQRGPLGENLPATVERLGVLYPPDRALVSRLAGRLSRLGCRLVLCDISPLGIAVAAAAGLPCVLVENFTWGWIYRGCTVREPGLLPFAGILDDLVALADLRLQAQPACEPAAGAVRVGPISRRPRAARAAVRAALGIAARKPAVLVTMGGIPHGGFAVQPLLAAPGVEFILAGAARRQRRVGNVLLLPHRTGLFHPDLVAAADAVVGKIGYSTVAETCRSRIPYGFVPRTGFRESAVLARWLVDRGRGLRIDPAAFASGEWVHRIPELLALGRPEERFPDGARQAAKLILERFNL
ncbi:MAG: hypothetical protein ACYC9Y_15660 [Candidatus Methylomirabilia bacterium]